nr:hypothetical protein [Gammaproteobacteria bacterium]
TGDNEDKYTFYLNYIYTNFIVTRNSSANADWDHVWDQTADTSLVDQPHPQSGNATSYSSNSYTYYIWNRWSTWDTGHEVKHFNGTW